MQAERQTATAGCQVCGRPAPAGHLICDECWPDKAIMSGRADRCAGCGRPRLVEKLVPDPDDQVRLICSDHLSRQT